MAASSRSLFQDLTDWSVVEPNGFPDYRYNASGRAAAQRNIAAARDRVTADIGLRLD
jgi:hypothetical protein